MRRITALVALVAVLLTVTAAPAFAAPATAEDAPVEDAPVEDAPVEVVVFHGEGCPHCDRMLGFLDELDDRVDIVVTDYEVYGDPANRARFVETLDALGETPRAVPTVVVGEQVFVGYSDAIADRIERAVVALGAGRAPDDSGSFVVDVPLLGAVDVGSRSLLGATVMIGFVDGVNPCSLWVLSMLLALVVHSGSRRRVLIVGGVFLTITSLLYGLYMLGAYSALTLAGRLDWVRVVVALVAGTLGVLHLKEHWTRRGPSVTIPADRKPGLFRQMRGLADPDRSLPAAIGSTAVLAVGVSLLETPCTAGLPLLWTDLVSQRDVAVGGAAMLFAVYLLVFLVDELVIFGAVVATMRATKLQEHHGRTLQLVGGTLMLTLATVMLAAPGVLDSVGGTALVFASAAGVIAAVLAIEWLWSRLHGTANGGRPTRPGARLSGSPR